MEDILAIRKTNSPNSPSKIKELLMQISNSHFECDKLVHNVEENETIISELSKEISELKQEFEIEKQNLETKINESEKQNRSLQSLKKAEEESELTNKQTQTKHKILKKTKPSLHDQQILEKGKRKHKLYKEFTGIRWDYSLIETMVEGYITNKKDFLKKISYEGDVDYKTIRELLWKDMERSTMDSAAREEDCKENKAVNK